MKLLTASNAKIEKTEALFPRWRVRIMHLAPAKLSGYETCPGRSPGCTAACLYRAGMGSMPNVQAARIARTKLYWENEHAFDDQLLREVRSNITQAAHHGQRLAIRPNGTSDLNWIWLARLFPTVQFYDYTKVTKRMVKWIHGQWPANYHLTWSLSERPSNISIAQAAWPKMVMACVGKPPSWHKGPKVNGDKHDLTFMHKPGTLLVLSPKGRAKLDKTGFVIGK